MTISMSEAYLSRNGQKGEQTSYDLIYYTFGEPNEITAETYVLQNKPATYNGYNFRTYSREQVVVDVYKWTLNYGSPGQQTTTGTATLNFNIGGGTQHITNSIANSRYRDTSLVTNDMDFGGTIGVELNDDGTKARVRGVEVYVPVLEYSYAEQFLNSDVTDSFIGNIYSVCGGMNNAPFYGRPAGSVLFKGCHGSKKGSEKWEITFDFAYSPNATNLSVGGITVTSKRGWDYLDVLYVAKPTRVNGMRVMLPGQATVHQVYPLVDFSLLGIGTH